MYPADTIVAPATAPGTGAVAIVRLSGPRAFDILAAIFRPAHPGELKPRLMRLGDIVDPATGARIDRAMAVVMRQPASLTGEDVVEIQCHGGSFLVRRIVATAIRLGARMAEPGEFSRLAFLNGRIDLAEAEAVADLTAARSDSAISVALSHLSGELSKRVADLRSQVIAIRAHLEVEIDFSEEDIRLPPRRQIASEIERLQTDVAILHDSFARGLLMREGVHATIIGKPNAGKSSLLNRLLGEDRMLVDPEPGTTRDAIDTRVKRGDKTYVFIDTAGIRKKGRVTKADDAVESMSVLSAVRAIERANVAVLVCDAKEGVAEQDAKIVGLAEDRRRALVIALNKSDLLSKDDWKKAEEKARDKISFVPYVPVVLVSAKTGRGVGGLVSTIDSVLAAYRKRVPTGELNRFFEEVLATRPPPTMGGRAPRLFYVTQAESSPPVFVVISSSPQAVHFSYQRFVINQLRKRFGFEGVPIRVVYRGRHREKR
jgi:ribosome-associated GTPase EngA